MNTEREPILSKQEKTHGPSYVSLQIGGKLHISDESTLWNRIYGMHSFLTEKTCNQETKKSQYYTNLKEHIIELIMQVFVYNFRVLYSLY